MDVNNHMYNYTCKILNIIKVKSDFLSISTSMEL